MPRCCWTQGRRCSLPSIRSTVRRTSMPTPRSARSSRCCRRCSTTTIHRPSCNRASISSPAASSSTVRKRCSSSPSAPARRSSRSTAAHRRFCSRIRRSRSRTRSSEYAINDSNSRHWDDPIRTYVEDCRRGKDGPRGRDFNMRWTGSPVADIYRIVSRGGIYLYPGDKRREFRDGRLRLIYEANPIAWVIEQAGGAASTGRERVLGDEANLAAPARAADRRVAFGGRARGTSARRVADARRALAVVQPPRAAAVTDLINNYKAFSGRHVSQTSHHLGHGFLGRRHHVGASDVREHFPPRAHHRRLHRGRRLPSLRPRRHGAGDRRGAPQGQQPLQPFRRGGKPARRAARRFSAATARAVAAARATTSTTKTTQRCTVRRSARSPIGRICRAAPTCCSTRGCTAPSLRRR